MIKREIYFYIIALIVISSLSFFFTHLFYKNDNYVQYNFSIFENNYLPKNINLKDTVLNIENYRNQLFNNCEKKTYTSDLLNFQYRKIEQIISLEFVFTKDNELLTNEINECINNAFKNYHLVKQEYIKDAILNSHINDKFVDLMFQYLLDMKIEPWKLKREINNFGYNYNRLSFSKNYKEPINDFEWEIEFKKPNIIFNEKIFLKKGEINKLSNFLIILISLTCFSLIFYLIFNRK